MQKIFTNRIMGSAMNNINTILSPPHRIILEFYEGEAVAFDFDLMTTSMVDVREEIVNSYIENKQSFYSFDKIRQVTEINDGDYSECYWKESELKRQNKLISDEIEEMNLAKKIYGGTDSFDVEDSFHPHNSYSLGQD
jgi:hypothetical protein